MIYKPTVYRILDYLFGKKYLKLSGAEILKATEKAYLIKHAGQKRWIPKQFVKVKCNKINVEKWILQKKFV